MAHIIDIMATINGQLNLISRWYDDKSVILKSLPLTPNFVGVSTDRNVELNPNAKINKDDDAEIFKVILTDCGDIYTPIYVCITTNISKILIDKIPVYINRGTETGPGMAYIINIPEMMFSTDIDVMTCAEMLNSLYFGLLSYDLNMKYKAEIDLIKYYKNETLKIPTYDLEMIIFALGCGNINLKSWYGSSYGKNSIDSSYILSPFNENDIPENLRKGIIETLNKHANKIGMLRDSIGDGTLIMDALYE
jgi:hypothetical protein